MKNLEINKVKPIKLNPIPYNLLIFGYLVLPLFPWIIWFLDVAFFEQKLLFFLEKDIWVQFEKFLPEFNQAGQWPSVSIFTYCTTALTAPLYFYFWWKSTSACFNRPVKLTDLTIFYIACFATAVIFYAFSVLPYMVDGEGGFLSVITGDQFSLATIRHTFFYFYLAVLVWAHVFFHTLAVLVRAHQSFILNTQQKE